jgi:hypothetical protein
VDCEQRASQPLGADSTASGLIQIEERPGEAEIDVVFIYSDPNFTGAEGSNVRDGEPRYDRSESFGCQKSPGFQSAILDPLRVRLLRMH